MTTKRIVWTAPDGAAWVFTPALKYIDKRDADGARVFATDDDAIAEILPHAVPASATDVRVVEDTDIPTDRIFRNAWTQVAGKFKTDMPKARVIHMDRIRVARDAELAKRDPLYTHANPADRATLDAERQKLLNLPQTFKLGGARSAAALDALWPAELPERI